MNILLQTDKLIVISMKIFFFCVGQDSNYKRNYYIINAYKVKLRSLYLHVYIDSAQELMICCILILFHFANLYY